MKRWVKKLVGCPYNVVRRCITLYGYIYLTVNTVNKKVYVGKHRGGAFDPKYKGSGTYLWNAIRKYGWDAFSVQLIDTAESEEELNSKEAYWISEFSKSFDTYNICRGGEGFTGRHREETKRRISSSMTGVHKSEETRKRMSEAQKNKTEETKKKISDTLRGHTVREETRRKISESNKGRKLHPEAVRKISLARIGVKRPDVSAALKGRVVKEDTRKKISESLKGRKLSEQHAQQNRVRTLGMIFINDGHKNKMVHKEELDAYLLQGYSKGRMKGEDKR